MTKKKNMKKIDNRQQKIIELRKNKWSWKAVGTYFGISRARAHQIGSGYTSEKMKNISRVVKERDNYTCQWQEKCKGNFDPNNLIVHHIDFNDRNNNLKNLTTLCRGCHTYFHLKFVNCGESGYRKTTKLKKCLNCDNEIKLSSSKVYCSSKCHKEYMKKKWTRVCNYCGKTFIVSKTTRWNYYRNHNKFKKNSYCSRSCFAKYIAQKKIDN